MSDWAFWVTCLAVLGLAYGWRNKSRKHTEHAMLLIRIDRDSVHAGDDTVSHAENIAVPANTSLAGLLEQIRMAKFLPSISGGRATWVIESSGSQIKTIGVLAQQWQEPRVMMDASAELAQHFAGQQPNLFFRYRCQIDPDTVYAQLQASVVNENTSDTGSFDSLAKYASYLSKMTNPGSGRC
ncbi:hypothetical protein UNDYM_0191 [Undibacterium sp. YM2]|uniref:hypothetical protein n=1 Tax=Undibacterium sp. YM2 TaxID=2058625 RepID=UPI001331FB5C|nr:hypothetical protein [Undibacterium sp. YM2]BBB64444.1 hypothetical protein UNDYM_0191 [Undibacterium sp. YM2]